MQPPAILSPFSSPPPKEAPKPKPRLPSTSEPELVPVVKKLDETPGYENVIRDSQRGTIKTKTPEVPVRKPEPIRSLNGIETDPTLVSNLLKESLAKPVPITVQTEKKSPMIEKEIKKEPIIEQVVVPIISHTETVVHNPQQAVPQNQADEADHKHKKEKKKKEKHKHKDRDKSKEERKKHKKDKEKEKKTESSPLTQSQTSEALKITIPREKLSLSPGLKIKIPKERLAIPPPPPSGSGIKIKISKEVLETSRKRGAEPEMVIPPKMARQNGGPHPEKVGIWDQHVLPYYVVQPPPNPYYYGFGNVSMPDYYFAPPMFAPPLPSPHAPQPPLPNMPPPPVPPPPPE